MKRLQVRGEGQTYTGRAGKEAATLKVEPTEPEEDSHAKNREMVHEANKVLEVENKNWCQFAEPCHMTSLW